MTILKKKRGYMWVNRVERVISVAVVFCEKKNPEKLTQWEQLPTKEAEALEATWLAEDEQARLASEGEETPQPDQPQAE